MQKPIEIRFHRNCVFFRKLKFQPQVTVDAVNESPQWKLINAVLVSYDHDEVGVTKL